MCGIAGLVSRSGGGGRATVAAMTRRLAHRGPDGGGEFLWCSDAPEVDVGGFCRPVDVALGHTRLAIIDLSDRAAQPMSSPDGRFHLVFNGEIYNYLEIRRELQRAGWVFRSGSDTEVLLAALVMWGPNAFVRLRGMFALALLDTQTRKLLLARDAFGIKPLYYAMWSDGFAFASEVPALLEVREVSRRAAPRAVHDYLRYGAVDQADQTMFEDIRRFPAGCFAEVSLAGLTLSTPKQYWAPRREIVPRTFDEAADRLRELFFESVRFHLRSDVPVGTALSGGLDSSAIVAAVRAVDPDLDLYAVSYRPSVAMLDEGPWIELAGASVDARRIDVSGAPNGLVADLDAVIALQGEPFVSTSIYAQYQVFRAANEAGIKVMLDGQGADELLGGYRAHLGARCASLLRERRWAAAVGFVVGSGRGAPDRHLRLRTVGRGILGAWGGARTTALLSRVERSGDAMLRDSWFANHGVDMAIAERPGGPGRLTDTLQRDLTRTSLPALLRYEDRNSMAWSVESRVPFLTTDLVDFVFSLPEAFLVSDVGISKAVLRAAMRGLVPDPIVERRDKIGFATPEAEWLRVLRPWTDEVFEGARDSDMPLDVAAVRRYTDAVIDRPNADMSRVWRWINLIRWSEVFEVDYR